MTLLNHWVWKLLMMALLTRRGLNMKKLDKVNNELAEQQHEKDLEELAPISIQEFCDYIAEIAKYTTPL